MEQVKEITVIVAEDEPAIRRRIVSILNEVPEIEVLCEVENGSQLVEQCLIHEPDAVFADIGLPKMNGMEAVQNLIADLPDLFVVFITAFTNYAVDAFEVSAVDYVLKPISNKRIFKVVSKLKKHISEKEAFRKQMFTTSTKQEKLSIKDEEGIVFLNQDEIIMLEKEQQNILIHTKAHIYETVGTISSFEQKLNRTFLKTHRSFIINLDKVRRIIPVSDRTGMIEFEDYGKKAHVSRKHLQELYRRLGLDD